MPAPDDIAEKLRQLKALGSSCGCDCVRCEQKVRQNGRCDCDACATRALPVPSPAQ